MDNIQHAYSQDNRFVLPYSGELTDEVLTAGLALATAPSDSVESCVAVMDFAIASFLSQKHHSLPPTDNYCVLKGAVTGNETVGYLVIPSPAYNWKGSGVASITPDAVKNDQDSTLVGKYASGTHAVKKEN